MQGQASNLHRCERDPIASAFVFEGVGRQFLALATASLDHRAKAGTLPGTISPRRVNSGSKAGHKGTAAGRSSKHRKAQRSAAQRPGEDVGASLRLEAAGSSGPDRISLTGAAC